MKGVKLLVFMIGKWVKSIASSDCSNRKCTTRYVCMEMGLADSMLVRCGYLASQAVPVASSVASCTDTYVFNLTLTVML